MLIWDEFKKDVRSEYSKVLDFLRLCDDGRQKLLIYNNAKQVRKK